MKLTSWNLRGLNSPGKLRILKNMIKMEKPQICFLQETKCNSSTSGSVLSKAWRGCNTVDVDASGGLGGLTITWNMRESTLSDFHASHHFIQATFHILGTNIHGHISNVYFLMEAGNKSDLLNIIEALNNHRKHPIWIIGGDFNMITSLEEKMGGRNRLGKHQIASKLDRFLISDNSVHLGGDITATILPHSHSDQWPISLQWQRLGNTTRRPFCFEEFWLTHPNFKYFIRNTWNTFIPPEASRMFQFQQKLKHLKQGLKRWNHETFGNIFQAQQDLHKEMTDLQQQVITGGHTEGTLEQEQRIHNNLEERRKQEEILWKKKSRIRWLKEDRRPTIDRITQNVPKLITEEQNELLLRPILTQEVDTAMSQLKEGKAAGPYGFTTTFFHTFWELIKLEVWQVVEESRALHWLLPSLNSTFITLIPKEEESSTPEKFRLISLCNVIYKVISKVIANGLKPLLPLLISLEKSGYVEGRQILDNIILLHEIIHSLQHSKQASMILKLDLSKAFDKLSWTYIQKMLNAFGFSPMWIRWIMSLITSTFFSILVNGIPSQPFNPSCGIRHDDPLSPFLFVLMVEGLGHHIKHALLSHQLKGISIHNSPGITH
eukprot:PITA_28889